MKGVEFLLFFPFLFIGGMFKIFEFPLTGARKAIYFLPFSLFSMASMATALFQMHRFADKKRLVMKQRRIADFELLKLILSRHGKT